MTETKNQVLKFLALLAVYLWFGSTALRADVTGTILGTVTDPTGASVPGATVTLGNSDTGLTRKATTDSIGFYQFLAVPVGENNSVDVEVKGFRKSKIGRAHV